MYVTARYLGIKKENLNYLFLLLMEDYQDHNDTLRESIMDSLETFGRALKDHGALVVPFRGDSGENLKNMLEKPGWNPNESEIALWFRANGPAILIINKDVDDFTPKDDPYIIISLRESIDDAGRIKIFELQELFDLLVAKAQNPSENLFATAPPELLALTQDGFWDVVEMKPGIWGFAINIKSAFKWLRRPTRIKTHRFAMRCSSVNWSPWWAMKGAEVRHGATLRAGA